MTMDDLDRRLIDMAQHDFPVTERPFAVLAERLATTEADVLVRVERLRESGVVRELGPVFELRRLGYTSTLCAARVREDCVDEVGALVSDFDEVTHNYLRDDAFNMWFTLIAPSRERMEEILRRVRGQEGVDEVLSLPAERMFKVRVRFPAAGDGQ